MTYLLLSDTAFSPLNVKILHENIQKSGDLGETDVTCGIRVG